MKRSELKRKTPMKRSTKPMNKRNPERQARERAETDGPCAAMARSMPCLVGVDRLTLATIGRAIDDGQPLSLTKCIGDTEPDHVRTRGARGKDFANVVPLCRGHHTERHTIGIRTFEKRYGVNLEHEAQKIADRVAAGGPEQEGSARPTPTATDAAGSGSRATGEGAKAHEGTSLTDAARRRVTWRASPWATPLARDCKGGMDARVREGSPSLPDQARTVMGGKQARRPKRAESLDLFPDEDILDPGHPDRPTSTGGETSPPIGPTSPLRLNPRFVEWLMNLPPGWTEIPRGPTACDAWGTPSCRCRQRPLFGV